MRTLLLALTFLSAAGSAAAAATQSPVTTASTAADALIGFDAYVAETLKAWQVPGVAISIVKDGRVVLAKGYGARDPATGKPMTEDTIFPIASMSKAFASFGVGLLVDDGKMSFDAPVSTYLKGFAVRDPAATAGLTLRDMLSHRSGLPRHDAIWYHNSTLTRDEVLTRAAHLESSQPLRGRYQYNNIMFVLSGLAIDRVAGIDWETFTTRRIFEPLAMDRTFFGYERALADPDHSGGRAVMDGKAVNIPLYKNTPLMNPAGGVYSTAEDLTNWMLVHLDGGRLNGRRIVQPSTLADMHSTHMPTGATVRDPEFVPVGYGLGWFTNMYRGRQLVQHGGNLPGISTLVALLPSERLGVTVLVNHEVSELRDALTRQIIDRFLPAAGKDWVGEALVRKQAGEAAEVAARDKKGGSRVAGTRPSHRLADYAGRYHHPGYGPLTVQLNGNSLVGRYNDDESRLTHWHYDVFDAAATDFENLWTDSRLQFVSDMAGRVAAVQLAIEPALPPAIFTRLPDAKLSDPAYLQRLTGTYELSGSKVMVALAGDRLSWTTAGGQPAQLLPAIGDGFVHERRRDAQIAFRTDATGRATTLIFTDASGVYEAKRIGD